jgi:hypothetical protein
MIKDSSHDAGPTALGFYYQSFFALRTLLGLAGDDGAVAVESADDVELKDNGQNLLFQLKHSLKAEPPPITISSKGLWRTLKAWIDILPRLSLAESLFHLVTIAPIAKDSPLAVLSNLGADRKPLVDALVKEAERVVAERKTAREGKEKVLPHADRAKGCEAFLALSPDTRLNLIRQSRMQAASIPIGEMEGAIAGMLTLLKPIDRPRVASRLIEWWDRQVVYSLCGKRPKFIHRSELHEQITALISDIAHERLTADFELIANPDDYEPDGMLTRQINLVDGKGFDLARAIQSEWKARQQRSKWINERPGMASKIADYDKVLKDHWSDEHVEMVELCEDVEDGERRSRCLELLRWSHKDAPDKIRPITPEFDAPYYVRGSYQVLAINCEVGWHPHFATLLGDEPL